MFATSVFYKPTDAHSYLYFDSSHDPNTKASTPYSQFLRLRRLCSDDEDFLVQSNNMAEFFTARNYTHLTVDEALKRAKQASRLSALCPVPPSDNIPIVYLLFHPHSLSVCRILHSNWHILENNSSVGRTFCDRPLVAFKTDLNLRVATCL